MAGVTRFQPSTAQIRSIPREEYSEDRNARAFLGIHVRATAKRKAPQAPFNSGVLVPVLAGSKLASKVPIRGGTSNPISNTKFV